MGSEIEGIQPIGPSAPAQPARVTPGGSGVVRQSPELGVTYDVDAKRGTVVIKLVDEVTQQVVREIPPEEVQQMRRAMDEMLGRLLDRRG